MGIPQQYAYRDRATHRDDQIGGTLRMNPTDIASGMGIHNNTCIGTAPPIEMTGSEAHCCDLASEDVTG
eukprot:scaffold84996_cov35-Tisochrysis_lutea.AAC.2